MPIFSSHLSHPLPDHMAVVRLSALGDVTLTTGVLQHWHSTYGTTFTVLTKAAFAPLFDHHPAVTRVVAIEPDDLRGNRQTELFQRLVLEFSGVPLVDLHGTLRTCRLGHGWRGPVYRYPKMAVARRLYLLSGGRWFKDDLLRQTVTQRYAQTLLPEGSEVPTPQDLQPRVFLTAEETDWADAVLAPVLAPFSSLNTGENVPLVALHPFATHYCKTWPMAVWLRFSALLDMLHIPHFWVGQGIAPLSIAQNRDFIDKTNLRQLAALLARADVLVTGDSGPMHIASGVDTPVVALFGPTCREWGFFPAGPRDIILQEDVPCRPCSLHGQRGGCHRDHACLLSIKPEYVLESVVPLLSRAIHPASPPA